MSSLCAGVSDKGVGKTGYFLALCVDIPKTVRDTTKVSLLLMTNRKSRMCFQLAPKSMTLDNFHFELL